jgi:hypothetical protein
VIYFLPFFFLIFASGLHWLEVQIGCVKSKLDLPELSQEELSDNFFVKQIIISDEEQEEEETSLKQ